MRRILAILTAVAISTGTFAQASIRTKVEPFLVEAVQKYDSGDINSAALALAQLKTLHPDNDAVLYYLGLCDLAMNDVHAAREHLDAAWQKDTSNLWYASTLANVLLAVKDAESAYPLLKKIIAENPATFASPYTLSIMGDLELSFQRDSAAMDYYDQALAMDPTYFAARIRKVDLYRLTGRDSTYKAEVESMINDSQVPEKFKPELHVMLMQYALSQNDNERVISEAHKLLSYPELDSTRVLATLSLLGDTYYTNGNRKQAYKVYDMALKLDPEYLPVLNNYAYFLSEERRQLKKALKMSRITIQKDPENPIYLDTCGWILHLLGHSDQAEPLFKQAIVYGGRSMAVILQHYADVLDAVGKSTMAEYYRDLAKKL